MPTTVTSNVFPGGGGDYTSLQAWESAEQGDLVSDDEIKQAIVDASGNASDGTVLTISGWTTDNDRYLEVIAKDGDEHEGTYSTSKAYMESNSSVGSNVSITTGIRTRWTKFQINMSGTTSGSRWNVIGGTNNVINRCILRIISSGAEANVRFSNGQTNVIKSSALIRGGSGSNIQAVVNPGGMRIYVFNNTCKGGTNNLSASLGGRITSENNYFKRTGGSVYNDLSRITQGSFDATDNTEASDPDLDSIPYSTSTFVNVTSGSEDFTLALPPQTTENKLINGGTDLSTNGGAGSPRNVTEDIIGNARPLLGEFDIGAFESQTPICWNYTANYKGSSRLFKLSGPGAFPKVLAVPDNVDISTGRMVDDGVLIDPDEYEIV